MELKNEKLNMQDKYTKKQLMCVYCTSLRITDEATNDGSMWFTSDQKSHDNTVGLQ